MIVSLHPEMHAAVGKQKPKSQSRKVYDSEDGDRFTNAVVGGHRSPKGLQGITTTLTDLGVKV
jgi:hypothetical protein